MTKLLNLSTLLVVSPDLALAKQIAQEVLTWGMKVQITTTLTEAEKFLNRNEYYAILLDLDFPSYRKAGLEFLAFVKQQHLDIPVIVITADTSLEKRVEVARLGSRFFLPKPLASTQVLATVAQVLRQIKEPIARILVVDDDPALLQFLSTLLTPCGYEVTLLSEAQHFWQTLEETDPDLLILDIELSQDPNSAVPPLNGIQLCQVIRSDLRWNRLPILFLSAHTDRKTVQRSFAAEADDFLSKPVVAHELLTRVRTRLKHKTLWQMTELDELTGVSLRRKALEDLTRMLRLAQRQQQPFYLAILDVDNFKQINDQYGHDTGDQVLSYFGKLLKESFRGEDIIGRWGGEEFVVGMYGITKPDGVKRLEKLLQEFNRQVFLAPNGTLFEVTFSGGIAQSVENGCDLQTLYHWADEALYRAKAAGRNRILVALDI